MYDAQERKERESLEERLAAQKREATARADAELAQLRREQLERVERLRRDTADEEAQVEHARDEVARSLRTLDGEQLELSRKACACTLQYMYLYRTINLKVFAQVLYSTKVI